MKLFAAIALGVLVSTPVFAGELNDRLKEQYQPPKQHYGLSPESLRTDLPPIWQPSQRRPRYQPKRIDVFPVPTCDPYEPDYTVCE